VRRVTPGFMVEIPPEEMDRDGKRLKLPQSRR
jgi:hypothetical protein